MIIGTQLYDLKHGFGFALCPTTSKDVWGRRRYLAVFCGKGFHLTGRDGFHSLKSCKQLRAIRDERFVGPEEARFALWVAGEIRHGMTDFRLTLRQGLQVADDLSTEDFFAELNLANEMNTGIRKTIDAISSLDVK